MRLKPILAMQTGLKNLHFPGNLVSFDTMALLWKSNIWHKSLAINLK
jgi:hypothetical protein